ncbi:MAG: RhuM family protein [Fibrobacter sp.]|nr:RhuM family protein [Fibrobacter sp.]MDY6389623.1 RhuM family protein [Fibrobacter sp.]
MMKNVGLLPSGEVDGGKNEIIVYQPEGGEFHIEVRVDQDTVWLTQAQMAELFNTDRTSINRHIRNIFQTQELYENSTCAKIAQVRLEGGRSIKRVVPYYNLDMIISVGYRVNSISGTRFRQWANRVLKEHMLRGFSVNQRLVAHENRLENIDSRVIYLEKQVDFFVKANLPPKEGVLQAKAFWSGYEFAVQLVRSAKQEIVIIDPFADDISLSLMPKRNPGVNAMIYSARINQTMKAECERLNRQCPPVELRTMREVHDRFIVVDETVYHIGASIKDLGNKLTAFSVLGFVTKQQLLEMIK